MHRAPPGGLGSDSVLAEINLISTQRPRQFVAVKGAVCSRAASRAAFAELPQDALQPSR